MPKFKVPYLARRGSAASPNFYFFPSSRHRAAGWKAVRLHDANGLPIHDELLAAVANKPLAQLYQNWMKGQPNSTPDHIDDFGRIRSKSARPTASDVVIHGRRFAPGTMGALAAHYMASKYYLTKKLPDGTRQPRSKNTLYGYKYAITRAVEEWGDTLWHHISAVMAEEWLEDLAEERGAEASLACYRIINVVCNHARKLYQESEPGYIPFQGHGFAHLGIPTQRPKPEPWPRDLVLPMVAFCDEQGFPSMGDAILFNSWLGQRPSDLIGLPLSRFDMDFPLWVTQAKTGADVVLPWQRVPVLVERYDRMMARRKGQRRPIAATTFTYDDNTGRPFTVYGAQRLFRKLRTDFAAQVAARHPKGQARWPAEYLVRHFEDKPFDFNLERMQFRTLRHTAVTLLADAEVEDIGAVSGHSSKNIDRIIRHYRAATASRAGAGFDKRVQRETLTTPKLITVST